MALVLPVPLRVVWDPTVSRVAPAGDRKPAAAPRGGWWWGRDRVVRHPNGEERTHSLAEASQGRQWPCHCLPGDSACPPTQCTAQGMGLIWPWVGKEGMGSGADPVRRAARDQPANTSIALAKSSSAWGKKNCKKVGKTPRFQPSFVGIQSLVKWGEWMSSDLTSSHGAPGLTDNQMYTL